MSESTAFVRDTRDSKPRVGVVLGSGLASIADEVSRATSIPYSEIPHFPISTVTGHQGRLLLGQISGKPVAVLSGRVHFYEGYSISEVVYPIRLLAALGCEYLIVTNAAGGINPLFWPGDLMAITDHINFLGLGGHNPLTGPEAPTIGDRFVDMKTAYDPALVEIAASVSPALGIQLRRGVYAMVPGPSYETPAEIRLLRAVGADAVGMSTAPEVVAARQLALRVLGVSCITNVHGADGGSVSHKEVVERGLAAGPLLASLIKEVIRRL